MVRYVLQLSKPIYNMTRFGDTDKLVIGKVYDQMDNMLGQTKNIVDTRDVILYDHIYNTW